MADKQMMKALVKKFAQPGLWQDEVPIPKSASMTS